MASWYERTVIPHLIKLGCGCSMLARLRAPVVSQARGQVLELGVGAWANLPHYDHASVESLTGIEPSDGLRAMAAQAARQAGLSARLLPDGAEALPFPDASFDTVVCTFTLCTVSDPALALREARRVLKPGGLFLFCEHGRAPDPGVARWQQRIDPLWRPVFGGCNLSRPVRGSIEQMFRIEDWQGSFQPGTPRIAGWMESGRAVAA